MRIEDAILRPGNIDIILHQIVAGKGREPSPVWIGNEVQLRGCAAGSGETQPAAGEILVPVQPVRA
jgi:hypothetical protein